MLIPTIKPILRQFLRRDTFKWLNVFGLAIGIASTILITVYITSEIQVGKAQSEYEEIFLLKNKNGATLSNIVLETLKNNLPEFNTATAFHGQLDKGFLIQDKKRYTVTDLFFGDSYFFEVFEFQTVYGDVQKAMATHNGCVLTQDMANKIFGDINPIGETLVLQHGFFDKATIVVNAVIENPETNAFVKMGAYINKKFLESNEWYKNGQKHWGQQFQFVFCKLPIGTEKNKLSKKINDVVKENAPSWFIEDSREFSLINISKLHFSEIDFLGVFKTNKKSRLVMLVIIGLFLLVIAWINFINLATARREKLVRLNEIKRNLGASKIHLITSSLLELIPTLFFSLLISICLVVLLFNPFNHFSEVSLILSDFISAKVIVICMVFIVVTLFVCALLPQWLLQQKTNLNNRLRSSLSIFQFSISIVLIIATLFIVKQNSFMQSLHTGYSDENILTVELKGNVQSKAKMFGEQLKGYSTIKDVTYASRLISNVQQDWGMSIAIKGENKRISYNALEVDSNFFQFFNIPIIAGHGFTQTSGSQYHHIFNETALKTFGIDDITTSRITSYNSASGDIIGVVKDFCFKSFHYPITPLGFITKKPEAMNYLYLRLNDGSPETIDKSIKSIEKLWAELEPKWPAEIEFLNKSTQKLYEADKKFSELILIVSIISILISCFGLLGVCKFMAERRTKEIGIRKVNGAKESEIISLLNYNFLLWLTIAFAIACPIAWYVMDSWLENFAYKTSLSWWIFALAGGIALCIELLTVSWQSWRAARRNPVEALRYE
jgi:putative ABC transport system permease protein